MTENVFANHHQVVPVSVELGPQYLNVCYFLSPQSPKRLADEQVLDNALSQCRVMRVRVTLKNREGNELRDCPRGSQTNAS
jgi:hypothetical protein